MNWDIQQLFTTSNLTLIANEHIALIKQVTHLVKAKNLQNLKLSDEEIAQWGRPNKLRRNGLHHHGDTLVHLHGLQVVQTLHHKNLHF